MQWNSAIRAAALTSAALAIGVASVQSPAIAQSEATIDYDLPAQDLGDTLRAIARASGREVIFSADVVRGRKAPAIKGRYGVDNALRAALSGSTLIVEYRAGAALVRERRLGTDQGVLSPASGTAITVTGTRIRGVGSASPVTVVSRRDLENAGISSLADFTRILPQNFTGGQNRGVAGGGEQGGQDNVNDSSTLNLRGLGPDATLTLLDGRRLSYDAVDQGIDISQIPATAIDRIELVSDGASALYGSDAVGGVANIILRRDYEGLETTARVGGSTDGGNFQQEYGLVGGHRWSSGGFMVALDRSSTTPIYANERDYTRSLDPSFTLTLANKQVSGILTGHQQINPWLSFDFDGYAMNRQALKQTPFRANASVFVSGLVTRPHVRSLGLTPTLRATIGSWETSLSATQASSRTLFDSVNYVNSSPRTSVVLYSDKLSGLEANGEGPLFSLPGGDARLAVGGGLRKVSLHDHIAAIVSGQSNTTVNFTQRRTVEFAYGELSLPLIQPDLRLPLINRLTLSGALRYEDWKGIAAVTTPKVGLIYQPWQSVTLRATWGKSFKVPTLYQVNEVLQGSLIPGLYFSPRPQPAGSTVLLLGGGTPGLKPERATTWSASAEISPKVVPGLDVEASYFAIDYRDRIAAPVSSSLTALYNPLYSNSIIYDPSAADVNAIVATLPQGLLNQTGAPFDPSNVGAIVNVAIRNTARERIDGFDILANYHLDLSPLGKLLITSSASFLNSKQQIAVNRPFVQLAGTIFNPPHWRARAGAVWDRDGTSLSAFVNYLGRTTDTRFPVIETIPAFTTVDLSASIQTGTRAGVFRNIEVRISALNVLNKKPNVIRTTQVQEAPFDSTNESPVGRFVGVSIRKVW